MCSLSLSPSLPWQGREDGKFTSCGMSTLLPEMVKNRHQHVSIICIIMPQRRGQRKSQTYQWPIDRHTSRPLIAMGQNKLLAYCPLEQPRCQYVNLPSCGYPDHLQMSHLSYCLHAPCVCKNNCKSAHKLP